MAKRLPSSSPDESARREQFRAWVRDRFAVDDLVHLAAKKQVPIHRYTIFYYLGGMALFLFLVQVATGILLLLYYRPSASEAFESVQYVMADVPFGWLIRSIHSWGANLFVGVVVLHAVSVFFLKAYRAPREVLSPMRQAALMAVRNDEGAGVGHIWLGAVSMLYDRNFPLAKRELERAVAHNPNSPDAHRWLRTLITAWVPASADSSSTFGSRSRAAFQNRESGPCPPA